MNEIKVTDNNGVVISRILPCKTMKDIFVHLEKWRHIYVVYDRNVRSIVEKIFDLNDKTSSQGDSVSRTAASIKAFHDIDASENNKSIDTVMDICRFLLENGADRDALLLAVGGGITTDVSGLAAALYKRGIATAYVPTTLLAQVDAAIGGKTGVNFLDYKNMVGVIRQPDMVFECSEVLDTLPYRDFLSGAAEMVKTFIIDDSHGNYPKSISILKDIAENNDETSDNKLSDRPDTIKRNMTALNELISAAAAIKAGVVTRDQFESGERRKLNLGHTFAHAIEWEAHRNGITGISHGEAVAIGIILAAKVSDAIGLSCALEEKLRKDFKCCNLPTECPFPLESLTEAMKKDKKAENGSIHFILMESVGNVVIKDIDAETVTNILKTH